MHSTVASGYAAAKKANLLNDDDAAATAAAAAASTFSNGASLEIFATAHSGITVYLYSA